MGKTCNVCGKQFSEYDTYQDFTIKRDIGYGSRYDLHKLDLSLCNACLDEWLDRLIPQCKISPVIECDLVRDSDTGTFSYIPCELTDDIHEGGGYNTALENLLRHITDEVPVHFDAGEAESEFGFDESQAVGAETSSQSSYNGKLPEGWRVIK